MRLVIVESPAKAKTIERFLPEDCKVTATMGHVIDLPKSKLGIDIENHFEPQYQTIRGKAPVLKEIKSKASKADEVILATDPDREGEAISYHIANFLGMDLSEANRIEFHEITRGAVTAAMESKRPVDMNLFNAQQARRVLDRLVGYKISPVLWKKVNSGLSAGRVQSVATRMVVDRENEIRAFVPKEYWNISADLLSEREDIPFNAVLAKIKGKKAVVENREAAESIVAELNSAQYTVASVKEGVKRKKSSAPFTTSTMQQDANRKLGFTTKRTMAIAQQLYEGIEVGGEHVGLVTYIRTDSTRIAETAKSAAYAYIIENYGKEYVGGFRAKAKAGGNVQDAHEAIRPTDIFASPETLSSSLSRDQLRLYTLIYKRFLASQMSDAVYDSITANIEAGSCELKAEGLKLKFPGFMKVYSSEENDEEKHIPNLSEGEILKLQKVNYEQKFTQPPARYTEASLVKALEEQGIGRPSTYSPTISTIQQRNYVEMQDKKFVPTTLGEVVTKLMVEHFTDIVDLHFTAGMEEKLDAIAVGSEEWESVIASFYDELKVYLDQTDTIEHVKIPDEETDEVCENCGRKMVIKMGRFGKFLACSGYPECKTTRAIVTKLDVKCPKCGSDIVVRKSKKGRTFYGCKAYPNCDFVSWNKPTDKLCPQCGKLLYEPPRGKKLFCADKDCGYKES